MTRISVALIAFYQRWLSPLGPPCCRFVPTCSTYARESLERHGLMRGLLLAVWRLLKCHPFHPGGYDPVHASLSDRHCSRVGETSLNVNKRNGAGE
jgi:putative membrane protein insertion efficiency factor